MWLPRVLTDAWGRRKAPVRPVGQVMMSEGCGSRKLRGKSGGFRRGPAFLFSPRGEAEENLRV